jgi:uracil-DNA glycosylase family 4
MAKKQQAFFMSSWDKYQKDNPEKFVRRKAAPRTGTSKASTKKVYDCETCGLYKSCRSPKMERFGEGKEGILIVGQSPSKRADRDNLPISGPSFRLLQKMMSYVGIDLDRDCWMTNIVQCYAGCDKKGKDKDPSKNQYKCCRDRLLKDIEETKPKLIICFGAPAINAVITTDHLKGFTANQMHGKVVPYHKFNCWVGCSFRPEFYAFRKTKKTKYPDDEIILGYDLANIISYLDQPLPQPLTTEGNVCADTVQSALDFIEGFTDTNRPTAFDYESTGFYPWIEGAELLSISVSDNVDLGVFIPLKLNRSDGSPVFDDRQQHIILEAWKTFLKSSTPKVVQNVNMEEIWNRMWIHQRSSNIIHDTMVAAHVINNNSYTTGLGFQAYMLTGHDYKGMIDIRKLAEEPIEKTCDYNGWDSRYTLLSYENQKRMLEEDPRLEEFYKFYHQGALELVNLRERGNKIDLKFLKELEDKYLREREIRMQEMRSLEGVRKYEEEFDCEFNPDSTKHLRYIMYDYYKLEKYKMTSTGGSTDKETLGIILEKTENKDVKKLIKALMRFRKTCSLTERVTNYRNVMDSKGYVHPSYNLNMADTYRSSCCDPNIQNVFKHDKELIIFRKAIVPSTGRILLEVDHAGMEVKGIAMASGDPELIRQIKEGVKWTKAHPEGGKNPWDTHYRWAARVYSKPVDEVTKDERYVGKNGFVFPSFYGSIDKAVARSFPKISMEHVCQVQKEFWEEYHYVREWQNKVIHDYLKNGYVTALNGWRRVGPLTINQLYNNLIQGVSFHVLLQALIKIGIEFKRRKLMTEANSEVHDSILFNTVPEEHEEVINVATEIMCSKHYDFQRDIPLGVDWEIGLRNWYDMRPIEINNSGKFVDIDESRIKLEDFIFST